MRFEFIRQHKENYSVSELSRILNVSRQGYKKYEKSLVRPPKHAALLAEIKAILEEDEYNNTYGRERIHDALKLKGIKVSQSTVYRICKKYGLSAKKNSPKCLTKAEKEAYKNDDLLKGDFAAEEPNKKLISDITQLPTKDGHCTFREYLIVMTTNAWGYLWMTT